MHRPAAFACQHKPQQQQQQQPAAAAAAETIKKFLKQIKT